MKDFLMWWQMNVRMKTNDEEGVGSSAAGKVEQRAYERYSYRAPIMYGFSNKESYYDGTMQNHSMGGMCFQSEYALPKGVEIYIKMTNYSPEAVGPESRKIYRAEVRWCREKMSDGTSCYEVGVTYFEPILYE